MPRCVSFRCSLAWRCDRQNAFAAGFQQYVPNRSGRRISCARSVRVSRQVQLARTQLKRAGRYVLSLDSRSLPARSTSASLTPSMPCAIRLADDAHTTQIMPSTRNVDRRGSRGSGVLHGCVAGDARRSGPGPYDDESQGEQHGGGACHNPDRAHPIPICVSVFAHHASPASRAVRPDAAAQHEHAGRSERVRRHSRLRLQ